MRYRCIKCGYTSSSFTARCPECGYPMEVVLEHKEWSLDEEEPSIWRYGSLLPPPKRRVSLGEGLTPLRRIEGIVVKDETKNPTGSYVDRGSSVLVSCSDLPEELELDFSQDVTVSISTYLLKSGVRVKVRVDPSSVELTELLYLSNLGVEISFDGGGGRAYESPFMIEGFKTIAFEVFESRGRADGLVIPAESGVLAYGVWKGFLELEELGLSRVPPIYLAYHGTVKTGLLEILEDRGARLMEVDATDALKSLVQLAKKGVYIKPVAAKAYSLAKELGGGVIAVLTGTGFRKWEHGAEGRPLTELQERILDVLREEGEMTAYQIWRRIEDVSLQGVYKALTKLVEAGMVTSRRAMMKRRKIRLYRANESGSRDGPEGEAEGIPD